MGYPGIGGDPTVCFVSTYPPTRCGIATYTEALVTALASRRSGLGGVGVARVLQGTDSRASHRREVIGAFDPTDHYATRAMVERLDSYDAVVLQHEFGIYGPRHGRAVMGIVERLAAPVVSVLHTVLRSPYRTQRSIVERLAAFSSAVVVLSESARTQLGATHRVDPDQVHLIPHGSRWAVTSSSPQLRPTVLTWGLLSPEKGIERGIQAMAHLTHLKPKPRYLVVGNTHPAVQRREGERYRRSLEQLVDRLGLRDIVEFQPGYLDTRRLAALVGGAHVVLLPYRSRQQVSSGVLSEALAAWKPVVATRFPHAEELLTGGAGIVVDHSDEAAMAEALRTLLTDPAAYHRAVAATRRVTDLAWSGVADRYEALLAGVVRRADTAVA